MIYVSARYPGTQASQSRHRVAAGRIGPALPHIYDIAYSLKEGGSVEKLESKRGGSDLDEGLVWEKRHGI